MEEQGHSVTSTVKSPASAFAWISLTVIVIAVAASIYMAWSNFYKPGNAPIAKGTDAPVSDAMTPRQIVNVSKGICEANSYWDYDAKGCRVITQAGNIGGFRGINFPSDMTPLFTDTAKWLYWTRNVSGKLLLSRVKLDTGARQTIIGNMPIQTEFYFYNNAVYTVEPVLIAGTTNPTDSVMLNKIVFNGTVFVRQNVLRVTVPGFYTQGSERPKFALMSNDRGLFFFTGEKYVDLGCACVNGGNFVRLDVKNENKVIAAPRGLVTGGVIKSISEANSYAGFRYSYRQYNVESGEAVTLAPNIDVTAKFNPYVYDADSGISSWILQPQVNTLVDMIVRGNKMKLLEYNYQASTQELGIQVPRVSFVEHMDGRSMVLNISDRNQAGFTYAGILTPQGHLKTFPLNGKVLAVNNGIIYYTMPSVTAGYVYIGQIVTNQTSALTNAGAVPNDPLMN